MSITLVIASLSGQSLDEMTRQAVTAALALGDRVTLGIAAEDPARIAAGSGIAGVDDVVGVQIAPGASNNEEFQRAVRTMINQVQPQTILMCFTAATTAFAAAIAQELDLGFASDVVRLERDQNGELVATRFLYAGRVHAELSFDRDTATLLLLRPSIWRPAATTVASPCRIIDAAPTGSRIHHVAFVAKQDTGFDLTQYDVILSVGRGLGSREAIAVFSEVAQKLGAALAASRPIVDAGWLPKDRQVGQSGASVTPRVYLAFGISGALQHLVGIRGARTIIAVNKDNDAPIFNVADYGAVADMFEVADELRKLA